MALLDAASDIIPNASRFSRLWGPLVTCEAVIAETQLALPGAAEAVANDP